MTIIRKVACLSLVALSLAQLAQAQVDRTKYPTAQAAPVINIKDAETFTLANGLRVFVVSNHKLPRVTISFSFLKTPYFEGEKAGLTDLYSAVFASGTKTKTKDQLDESIDRIGARLSVGSSGGYISYLKKYEPAALAIFSDILLNPSFPEDELKKEKTKLISALASSKDSPDEIAGNVVKALLYSKQHPYGELTTEKTLENITSADLSTYYQTYFRPNISYVSIVGDITLADAKKLANANFGKWQKKDVPSHTLVEVKAPASPQVALVDKPSAVQSVITVAYPIQLSLNDPNLPAVSLLSYIFGGGSSSRLFLNLRESKGYTYGAYGGVSSDRYVGDVTASASVRTEVTDSAIHEIIHEIKHIRENSITAEELKEAKAYLSGSFGRSLESPNTLANFAQNIAKNNLPADYYKNYLKNLNNVTLAQLQELAVKYFTPEKAHIIVVGNTAAFADKVARFGKVTNYDANANVLVKKDISNITITPAEIIRKYIDAIGGEEKIKSFSKFTQTSEAEIQGMKIQQKQSLDEKAKTYTLAVSMNGQLLSEINIVGDKITMKAMGKEQPVDAALKKSLLSSMSLSKDLKYLTAAYKLTLKGIEPVNGQDAYHLEVAHDGDISHEYYSVESGLNLKSQSTTTGEITYDEYAEVQGIKIPVKSTVNTPAIPMPLIMIVKETLFQ